MLTLWTDGFQTVWYSLFYYLWWNYFIQLIQNKFKKKEYAINSNLVWERVWFSGIGQESGSRDCEFEPC